MDHRLCATRLYPGRYRVNRDAPCVALMLDGTRANMLAEVLEGEIEEGKRIVRAHRARPDFKVGDDLLAMEWLALNEGIHAEICIQLKG